MLFLLLMGVGVFYILQQILYEKYWNRGLGIAVRFESHAVYEGDTAFLREEITNDKLLPLPALEVNLAVDRALKFSGEAKENANRRWPNPASVSHIAPKVWQCHWKFWRKRTFPKASPKQS